MTDIARTKRFSVTVFEMDQSTNTPTYNFQAQVDDLTRSTMVLHGRKMLPVSTKLLVVLKMKTAGTSVIGCEVQKCEYTSDGQHQSQLMFTNHAYSHHVRNWMKSNGYTKWLPPRGDAT